MIDCIMHTDVLEYEWISEDPAWLEYLSDDRVATPRFNAPGDIDIPQQMVYRRFGSDEYGVLVDLASVSITVNPAADCVRRGGQGCPLLRDQEPILDDGETSEFLDTSPESSTPFLDCEPRITVESGATAEISCTGLHPSGGLLTYNVEFDWPPYNETRVLADGAFDYLVRVPLIDGPAAVRMLEITASVPGEDLQISEHVEVHIVNHSPVLICEDMTVEEDVDAVFPCSVTSDRNITYQFISEIPLVQRGVHDHWPKFKVPEVHGDRSFPVIVRAFGADAGQVLEADFIMTIRDMSGRFDFRVECDPIRTEVYEGEPPLEVTCRSIEAVGPLVWGYAALGESPLELWLPVTPLDQTTPVREFRFDVPAEVEEDKFYQYEFTATDQEGNTASEDIFITVLERSDIVVSCEDAEAQTGDPPLELSCEVSNSRELELEYQWTWTPTTRLLGDLDGTPMFDVPATAEQQGLIVDYVYEVTASAENADSPEATEQLTVTVTKYFGSLGLECTSPVEVYEGDPDVTLNCQVQGFETPEIDLTWTWQALGEDRLSLLGGNLIFQTPASVSSTTTYSYDIQVDAPPHYDMSTVERVDIIVIKRPILSLECQDLTVTVGMAPERIQCEVSNDQGIELDYVWQWNPTTRLSDTSTGTPLFAAPIQQRTYSQIYIYTVTVQVDNADPVEATVTVTVVNPDVGSSEVVSVSTSELDLGVVGPDGEIWLDPATEQVSGLVYGGDGTHAGRMMVRAQDDVAVAIEFLESAVLRPVNLSEGLGSEQPREVTLIPQWAYSESCVQFAANTQASQTVQASLQPGDCHVLRVGGTVVLEKVEPGDYSGEVAVVVTTNNVDELYSIPVVMTVETERRVVVLGPEGISIRPVPSTTETLQWDQGVSIQPQVAVIGADTPSSTFTMTNPSVHPMEIEVSTEFGYRETQEAGQVLVTSTDELGNMAELISVYPNVVVLLPGETKQLHYAIPERELHRMEDRGYAAIFNFTVTPRAYIDQSSAPVAEQSARVTFQVPAAYIPERGPEQLRATLESRTSQGAVMLIETDSYPFYGHVVVQDNNSGEELGRSEVLVYTRSQVYIGWDADPLGGLSVQFVPFHPDQVKPNDVHIPENN